MQAKFVYEKFSDESDSIRDLGIGIKHKIEEWIKKSIYYYSGKSIRYNLNSDLTININDNCNIIAVGNFPSYINFNEIFGNFLVERRNLTTLRGCPKIVHGDFLVYGNNLTNLIGGPKIVDGVYGCSQNPSLISFKGMAKEIGQYVACNNDIGLTIKDIPKGTKIKDIKNCCIGKW